MAIWQYDFVVAPRDELQELFGAFPARLTPEQFRALHLWRTRQPASEFQGRFKEWQPEMKSWSPELRMWGHDESNRIDVSIRCKRVTWIVFRVEIRSISIRFLELLAGFARAENCVLISAHSLKILDPKRESILHHLSRSPGAETVWSWLYGKGDIVSESRPRVFLSHSSADKAFVARLAADLNGRNVPVWFDQWELKVGDSLSEKIAAGIGGSGWLAVVLSKSSVQSAWVQKELNAAQARELQSKSVFVLPLILDDCQIPLFLLDKVYADFRNSYESGLDALLNRVLDGRGDDV